MTRRRRGAWLWLVLGVALVALTSTARADDKPSRLEEARAHFELGRAQFKLGNAEAALRAFDEAYRLDPRPLLLYNAGLAARKAEKREVAIDRFRRYLRDQPRAPEREEVTRYLAELKQQLRDQPPPEPVSPAPPPVATPAVEPAPSPPAVVVVAPAPAPPHRVPVYRRWWLWTTISVVAVGAGLGVGLVLGLSSPLWKPTLPDVSVRPMSLSVRF